MSKLLRTGLNAGDSAPLTVVGGEGGFISTSMMAGVLIDGSNTRRADLAHRPPGDGGKPSAGLPIRPVVNEGWTWIGREKGRR